MKILQIVPKLPPSIDGVGDYAFNLALGLKSYSNIQTEFLVGDSKWKGTKIINGFPVINFNSEKKDDYLEILNKYSLVLLQYVGYGYEKRGCPYWLINGIE